MNRDDEAKAEEEKAVRLKGDEAEWWATLGALARKMGEKSESVRALRKAVEIEPKNAERHYALGQALREAGDGYGAIVEWRSAVDLQPEYAAALYALSRALASTNPGESKELQARFMRLQTLQRATDEAQMIGNDALRSSARGDWAAAISELKLAIERCGGCNAQAQLHKNLGLTYCQSGDLKNGEMELLEADKLMPNDADIAKALQILRSK
jgi:tetratricopeptide (TPR) repeat protein